jgi:hypothetical protein
MFSDSPERVAGGDGAGPHTEPVQPPRQQPRPRLLPLWTRPPAGLAGTQVPRPSTGLARTQVSCPPAGLAGTQVLAAHLLVWYMYHAHLLAWLGKRYPDVLAGTEVLEHKRYDQLLGS